jgi:K+-sensing histidine kinase KdpD
MERAFFSALGHACAQALERVRLSEEERRAHQEARAAAARLRALGEASDAFTAANRDLGTLLDTVTRQVVQHLSDTCHVQLLSGDGSHLELAALHGRDAEVSRATRELLEAAPMKPGEGLAGRVLLTGETLRVRELDTQVLQGQVKPEYRTFAARFPTSTVLAVPLRMEGRVMGVLTASRAHPGQAFTQADQEFLEELAAKAALSLENARLFAEQQRAEAELRQRADFEQHLVGIVSHDLRNPLAAISMSAGLLHKKGGLSEPQQRMVLRISQATERAARMIRDLLDFTKARLGGGIPLHVQPMDLHEVVKQVVDEVLVAHPDRHVDVVLEGEGLGEWDPDRVAQVLTNLVGNALVYSPPDAPVRVRATCEGQGAVLEVFNGGEPIPEELLPRLFEPLTRGTLKEGQSSRSIGLGLYIVRDIVRGHGGGVDVVSTADAGTTFTVRLPRAGG